MHNIKLSESFTLGEFLESETAERLGITEQFDPPAEYISNMVELCANILQPLRDQIGKPIRITSGYRCDALNKAIGGSTTFGRAADLKLYVGGEFRNDILFKTIIEMELPFYQLISEFGTYDRPKWVHVAFRKDNPKGQILRAEKVDGKTRYTDITKNL